MSRFLLLLILFYFGVVAHSQNLAPNGNYESFTLCPNAYSQLNRCTSWNFVTGHTGTTDYFNTCGPSPVNTTSAFWGPQTPGSGNGYIGLLTWHSGLSSGREYAQVQLTSPLVAGQVYTISLNASLGDICNFATPLHVYLSNAAYVVSPASSAAITAITPQVIFATVATNRTAWTNLSYNYTAVGGEQYLIVGNFNNDATIALTAVPGGSNNQTYYYVDDFSVVLFNPLPVELASFDVVCEDETTQLTWSTHTEQNSDFFTIEGSSDGIHFNWLMEVDAAGNSNELKTYNATVENVESRETYYRLSQTDYDGRTTAYPPVFSLCNESSPGECPNAYYSGEELIIEMATEQPGSFQVDIMDYKGSTIHTETHFLEKGIHPLHIDGTTLAPGIYILQIAAPTWACNQKFVVI